MLRLTTILLNVLAIVVNLIAFILHMVIGNIIGSGIALGCIALNVGCIVWLADQ